MVKKTSVKKLVCPHCNMGVKLGIKSFGQSSPKCPNCGEQILVWLGEDYNVSINVSGGTGARKTPRKYKKRRRDT